MKMVPKFKNIILKSDDILNKDKQCHGIKSYRYFKGFLTLISKTPMTCDGRNQRQICALMESDNQISIHDSCSACLGMKTLAVMGFEPTPPERLVPKTSALDHSATLTYFLLKMVPKFTKIILKSHDILN